MKQPAVIFDCDGTLADCRARLERAKDPETGKMDWEIFYLNMDKDLIAPEVRTFARLYRKMGTRIFVITGRPQRYDTVTWAWLDKNEVPYDVVFFRGDDDFRPAPTLEEARRHFDILRHIFEISSDHQCTKESRVAWDMYQVIRYRLAWDRNPKGAMTVDFDEPLRRGDEEWAKMEGL